MNERVGVLVMAYGSPEDLHDVERYYTHIRGGRPPPPHLLEELVERYRAIGGRSPLPEITSAQARGLQERLGVRCYVGFKHAPPFIADAVGAFARDDVQRAVGLVMAPHHSSLSVGDYARRAERAARELGWPGRVDVIPSWHLAPGYVAWLADRVREVTAGLREQAGDALVIFSAHSLPARIVDAGDPYPDQLAATAEAVARRAGIARFRVGWQSAGRTDEPWLGPDVTEIIKQLARDGERAAVVCPCGFVADHLEVLYDIDIEATGLAGRLGMTLARTPSPNDDPAFLDALAAVVETALRAGAHAGG